MWHDYDIRRPAPSVEASEAATAHEKYLWNPAVMAAIGASTNYTYCSAEVSNDFSTTGDGKTLTSAPSAPSALSPRPCPFDIYIY